MASMIRCRSCGAEFDENLRQCPYCGTGNEAQVEREHAEALREVERQRRDLAHLPKQIARLWGKRWGRILLLAVTVILLGGLLWALGGGIAEWIDNKTAPVRQEKHLQELEKLIAEENYEDIWEYLYRNDLCGGVYGGYFDLYFTTYPLYYVNECRELLAQGGIWRSTLGRVYREVARGIWETDEKLRTNVYEPTVEAAMQKVRAQMESVLTEDLGMREEELAELLQLSQETAEENESEELLERFLAVGEKARQRQGIRVVEDGEALE